jgi:hypothetical protein
LYNSSAKTFASMSTLSNIDDEIVLSNQSHTVEIKEPDVCRTQILLMKDIVDCVIWLDCCAFQCSYLFRVGAKYFY